MLVQKGPERRAVGRDAGARAALAKRLGVPVEFVIYHSPPARVFDGAKENAWDIGFIAIEPVRAAEVDFTPPYVLIQGTYLVRKDSPLKDVADVDKPGHEDRRRPRLGLRPLSHAHAEERDAGRAIRRAAPPAASSRSSTQQLDAAAGVREPLDAYAKDHPETRVLPGCFEEIKQAIGTPKGRGAAGLAYLRAFVEEMKANGFVADALEALRPDRAGRAAGQLTAIKSSQAQKNTWELSHDDPSWLARLPRHSCSARCSSRDRRSSHARSLGRPASSRSSCRFRRAAASIPIARMAQPGLQQKLNATIVIENRPGSSGSLGTEIGGEVAAGRQHLGIRVRFARGQSISVRSEIRHGEGSRTRSC